VPFITGYLIWINRKYYSSIEASPDLLWGGIVLAVSGSLLVAGRVGGLSLAEAISLLLVFPGIVLVLWGRECLKAVALPLAYLQFMVPWTNEFIDRVHWPFQILSAKIGVAILGLFDTPVYLEGKYILLPNITLEVAKECSGVAYLTSVVAFGILLVYLTQRSWKRGIVVILAGVLVTIVTNGARVALVSALAHRYGGTVAHGPGHIFQGWLAAQVGFIAIFVVNWFISRGGDPDAPKLYERWKSSSPKGDFPEVGRQSYAPYMALIAYLAVLGVSVRFVFTPVSVPLKKDFSEFPLEIGPWKGKTSNWLEGESYFPGVDAQLKRVYVGDGGVQLQLYIGYFAVQGEGKALINYRAERLRREGKNIVAGFGGKGSAAYLESQPRIDGKPYQALIWYRFPDRETSGRYETKLKGITDALTHRRNNGAVILIASQGGGGKEASLNQEVLLSFARELQPVLGTFLP
jgi:EpsI family protein